MNITLYRPVGPQELDLIRALDYSAFPPRLPEQPIFYPVTNREYAIQIARDWNVKGSGSGFVTEFDVNKEFIDKYDIHTVGSAIHTEYWIPAEDLDEFNKNIIGKIRLVDEFYVRNT